MWLAFSDKINLIFYFWFKRNVAAFESSTKFRISTNYDRKRSVTVPL